MFYKKVVLGILQISQNSQENRSQACNLIKEETLAQVFSCEFYEISKNTFFIYTSGDCFCKTAVFYFLLGGFPFSIKEIFTQKHLSVNFTKQLLPTPSSDCFHILLEGSSKFCQQNTNIS